MNTSLTKEQLKKTLIQYCEIDKSFHNSYFIRNWIPKNPDLSKIKYPKSIVRKNLIFLLKLPAWNLEERRLFKKIAKELAYK